MRALTLQEFEERRAALQNQVRLLDTEIEQRKQHALAERAASQSELDAVRRSIVECNDTALLQEAGLYSYRHPLADAVAYRGQLEELDATIKEMNRKDGGAVVSAGTWTVNGSTTEGRAMVREVSKLMLRAFNAEADNLVRTLKPYRRDASIERLVKIAETIEKLGKTMQIRVSDEYLRVRVRELELTADFLQRKAEEKEAERAELARIRDDRKAEQELEQERRRLEKEKQHYGNALRKLRERGDTEAAVRMQAQIEDVDRALNDIDFRAANSRAGYVYVISNIGSFGERMIKVGMTRRLDPMERVYELSDASVPFDFDVHALFFSKDAVALEAALHERLSHVRVNLVNRRREFFYATAADVREHLKELAGDLLEYDDAPEALEFRQSQRIHSGVGPK